MRWRERLIVLCSFSWAGAAVAAEPVRIPVARASRDWVYANAAGGTAIAGPFLFAAAFAGGLARVSPGGAAYGFVDSAGRWRIRPRYESARDFSEGLAAIALRPTDDPYTAPPPWGFIDTQGRTVIEPHLGDVQDFHEGLAGAAGMLPDSKWGFIDRTGTFVIAPQFEDVGPFVGGLARATTIGEDGSHVEGFIDRRGKWHIEPKYRAVGDFARTDSRAWVSDGDKCGYVDPSGAIVVALEFTRCTDFVTGLAAVATERGWTYIDPAGHCVLPGPFSQASPLVGNLAAVQRSDGGWQVIDSNGAIVLAAVTPRGKGAQPTALASAEPLASGWIRVTLAGDPTARPLWVDRKGRVRWQPRERWSTRPVPAVDLQLPR